MTTQMLCPMYSSPYAKLRRLQVIFYTQKTSSKPHRHPPTLELEVEQYLAAMNENIGIVDFWQASD